ncbi:MAG TPA: hypothetical protein VFB80_13020 [Pirellulaceae bacterium]|nr:hypothetical protein [Pirellulaceae bacterium]
MLIAWILIPLGLLAALYGFHRFMLYLENCDPFSSWRSASGGSGYNPLLEIYQPQIRHIVQAQEQRLGDSEDDAGRPPLRRISRPPAPSCYWCHSPMKGR